MSIFGNLFKKKDPGEVKAPRDFGNISEYKNYGRSPIECIIDPTNREPVVFETESGYEVFEQQSMTTLTDAELRGDSFEGEETERRIFAVLSRGEKKYLFEISDDKNELSLFPVTDAALCEKVFTRMVDSDDGEVIAKTSEPEVIYSPADAMRVYISRYGRERITDKKRLRGYLLEVMNDLGDDEPGPSEGDTRRGDFDLFLRAAEYGICASYLKAAEKFRKLKSEADTKSRKSKQTAKEAELEFCRIEDKLCGGIGITDRDAEKITFWIKSALGIE